MKLLKKIEPSPFFALFPFFLTIYHIRNTIYEKCRETTFLDITERVN